MYCVQMQKKQIKIQQNSPVVPMTSTLATVAVKQAGVGGTGTATVAAKGGNGPVVEHVATARGAVRVGACVAVGRICGLGGICGRDDG